MAERGQEAAGAFALLVEPDDDEDEEVDDVLLEDEDDDSPDDEDEDGDVVSGFFVSPAAGFSDFSELTAPDRESLR